MSQKKKLVYKAALRELEPVHKYEGYRLKEDVKPLWLWLAGGTGVILVLLAILLDMFWGIDNILPSVALSLGVGAMLFCVLFLLERRIVRGMSMRWVSALEALTTESGEDPDEVLAHYSGPVAAVYDFIDAVMVNSDYREAWRLADPNWRLCRAQSWIWNNLSHPLVSKFDKEMAAHALADANPEHALWDGFASTELEQFRSIWSEIVIKQYGAASRKRRVDDGEVVLLANICDYPRGVLVQEKTEMEGCPFLVRKIGGIWCLANHLGDHLPAPGWPPDWKEGWTY
jgi:hypothetical protein